MDLAIFIGVLQGIVIENGHQLLEERSIRTNDFVHLIVSLEEFAIFFRNDLKIREGLIEKAWFDIFHLRLQAVISSGNVKKVSG